MTDGWCLSQVEIDGVRTSCRIDGGLITAVGSELTPRPGDRWVDGRGAALLPGLADHHVHLWATAAARASVDLDGTDDLRAVVGPPGCGWLRMIGAGRLIEKAELDDVWPDRPVRIQHRSGAVWTLNTAAISQLAAGLDTEERYTGQLWRTDERLRALLEAVGASIHPDLVGLGHDLARLGITHVTDATPAADLESLTVLPQHVLSLARAASGRGPVKLVLADHELPNFDELIASIRELHEEGRPVAIHAVTQLSLALAVAAIEAAATVPGDRVEHAAVCDDALAGRLADLGVTVVTQPGLWSRRGLDFLAETPVDEHPLLWRCASLLQRGVRIALSSDAPYGPFDPWATIRAAATRTLGDGSTGGASERITPAEALRSLLTDPLDPAGPSRVIAPGAPADLLLLDQPLERSLAAVVATGASPVRMTLISGAMFTSDPAAVLGHGCPDN